MQKNFVEAPRLCVPESPPAASPGIVAEAQQRALWHIFENAGEKAGRQRLEFPVAAVSRPLIEAHDAGRRSVRSVRLTLDMLVDGCGAVLACAGRKAPEIVVHRAEVDVEPGGGHARCCCEAFVVQDAEALPSVYWGNPSPSRSSPASRRSAGNLRAAPPEFSGAPPAHQMESRQRFPCMASPDKQAQREEAGEVPPDAPHDLTQARGSHCCSELILGQEQRHGRDRATVLEQRKIVAGNLPCPTSRRLRGSRSPLSRPENRYSRQACQSSVSKWRRPPPRCVRSLSRSRSDAGSVLTCSTARLEEVRGGVRHLTILTIDVDHVVAVVDPVQLCSARR